MRERLKIFITFLNTSEGNFEKKVGLTNGHVSNIGDSMREATLKKISVVYPELNINWLKTGEGEMLKTENINQVQGDNKGIVGNHAKGNYINDISTIENLIHGLSKKFDNMLIKKDEQMNELISIIKDLTPKNK
jgi:hypothetical protein